MSLEIKKEKDSFIYILEFFVYILDNKKFISIFNLLILLISLPIVFYLFENFYITKVSFISPSSDMISNYSDVLTMTNQLNFKTGPMILNNPSQIYLEILGSRRVKNRILEKIDIKEYYNSIKVEDQIDFLSKELVSTKSNAGLIEISVKTKSPELSYKISKEYLSVMSKILNEINVTQAKDSTNFIEKRLNETIAKLDQVSNKLKDFQLKNSVIDVKKQSEGLFDVISEIEKTVLTLEAKLNSLRTIYKDNSPQILSIKAQIDKLKSEEKSLKNKDSNRFDKLDNPSIYDIPKLSQSYLEINRNLKTLEEVFTILIKEYEISKIKQSKENQELKIIDEPYIPLKKSGPSRLLLLIAFMIISFSLSLIYLLIKFNLNEIISKLDDDYHIKNLKSRLKIVKSLR